MPRFRRPDGNVLSETEVGGLEARHQWNDWTDQITAEYETCTRRELTADIPRESTTQLDGQRLGELVNVRSNKLKVCNVM